MRRLLLEHKVDVNAKDKYGATALHRVAENGHEVVVATAAIETFSQSKTFSLSNKSGPRHQLKDRISQVIAPSSVKTAFSSEACALPPLPSHRRTP
jgi:ankyrin repeat protein